MSSRDLQHNSLSTRQKKQPRMASLDSYSEDETSYLSNTNTPAVILEEALTYLALASAATYRAGPAYVTKSEPFWFFAAGPWSRCSYRKRVEEASKKLPKRISARNDVYFATDRLRAVVLLLRGFGDVRDAEDLEEAVGLFLLDAGEDW